MGCRFAIFVKERLAPLRRTSPTGQVWGAQLPTTTKLPLLRRVKERVGERRCSARSNGSTAQNPLFSASPLAPAAGRGVTQAGGGEVRQSCTGSNKTHDNQSEILFTLPDFSIVMKPRANARHPECWSDGASCFPSVHHSTTPLLQARRHPSSR